MNATGGGQSIRLGTIRRYRDGRRRASGAGLPRTSPRAVPGRLWLRRPRAPAPGALPLLRRLADEAQQVEGRLGGAADEVGQRRVLRKEPVLRAVRWHGGLRASLPPPHVRHGGGAGGELGGRARSAGGGQPGAAPGHAPALRGARRRGSGGVRRAAQRGHGRAGSRWLGPGGGPGRGRGGGGLTPSGPARRMPRRRIVPGLVASL